jgi:hypothetical protein
MPCESRRMGECPKRGLGCNEILAPEEPNVYSTVIYRITRAPAERNVFGHDGSSRARFAPLERGRILSDSCFYKHFVTFRP